MQMTEIVAALDSEIARLQQVRGLLMGSTPPGGVGSSGGEIRKKRHLSADARARIAAAQKKRWANAKKTTK